MQIPSVDIILATYNGCPYIEPFFESLLKQSFQNFRILIRDDGSKDETLEVIKKFRSLLDIHIIEDDKGNLGFYENFSEILSYAQADYLFLSDQDDIWDPDKLLTYVEIFEHSDCLAIFSSFKIIDQHGRVLKEEMRQGFNPDDDYKAYYWGNNATGCTMALRRSLLDDARLCNGAHYHDWKLALAAARSGRLYFLPNPLTHYRMHLSQSSGFSNRKNSIFNVKETIKIFKSRGLAQAKNLRSIINDPLYVDDLSEIRRSLELHILISSDKYKASMLVLTFKILLWRDCVSFKSLLYKNIVNICKLWNVR